MAINLWSRIKQELSIEYDRYTETKFGKLVAAILYYVIFTTSPTIISYVVPFLLHYVTKEIAYVIIVISTIAITELFMSIFFLAVYKAKWSFFQQYRVHPNKPWPWQQNAEKWNKQLWRSIGTTCFNILIFAPSNILVQAHVDFRVQMDPSLAPSLGQLIPQFFLMMIIEDFIFFSFHILLHQPYFYKFHKIHHEYTTSVAVAGLHFHVVEFFFIQSVSFLINVRLALLYGPVHISTLVSWFILRIWDANLAHSGYKFPWAPIQLLPFCTNDDFHDFHHSQNSGNYGSEFRWWDLLFGTTSDFLKCKRQQQLKSAGKKEI